MRIRNPTKIGRESRNAFPKPFIVDEKLGNIWTIRKILNQRSQDMLAANNWNVVQYATLTMMMAQVSGFEPGEFIHVIADAHIYDRHVPVIEELITKEPKPAPKFLIDPEVKDFYAFTRDSFKVEGYEYHEFTGKIPVAV